MAFISKDGKWPSAVIMFLSCNTSPTVALSINIPKMKSIFAKMNKGSTQKRTRFIAPGELAKGCGYRQKVSQTLEECSGFTTKSTHGTNIVHLKSKEQNMSAITEFLDRQRNMRGRLLVVKDTSAYEN